MREFSQNIHIEVVDLEEFRINSSKFSLWIHFSVQEYDTLAFISRITDIIGVVTRIFTALGSR